MSTLHTSTSSTRKSPGTMKTHPVKHKLADLEGPPCTIEPDERGLGQRYLESLNKNRDKIHQVDPASGLTETNGSVRARGIQVATEMRLRGIGNNDVVVICSRTNGDQTVAVLATLLIGAVVAPIDPDLTLTETLAIIKKLRPKMAFCDLRSSGQFARIFRESSEAITDCQIIRFGSDHADKNAFEKFLFQKTDQEFKSEPIKDSKSKVAFIVPTQAVQETYKLVMISHYSVQLQTIFCENEIFAHAERILTFFPLCWITQVIVTCLCFDAVLTRVLPGAFNERNAWKLIHDMKIDFALLGTDYALRMINHSSIQDFDLSCLKTVVVGGSITSAITMMRLRSSLHKVKFLQFYGLTEMGGIVAGFKTSDYALALENPASTGKLFPGVKVRFVDIDTRETLSPDKWGELLITGPSRMMGYYNDLSASHAVMDKGYIKTSDVALYDRRGCLYIQGTIHDLVEVNGIKFSPTELEEFILSHPYVTEVCVIGDHKELIACVIKRPDRSLTAERLMTFIAERMPENRRPTKIKFFESFPKTLVGKLRKVTMKENILSVQIQQSKSIVSF